jgi:hypothetical protein
MMSGSNPGMGSGLASIFGGMFGDSGAPYGDAMKQFKRYYGQSQDAQNPFYKAGIQGMGNFQDWLGGMKDTSAFINKLMGGYQQSPWAQNLQNQSMRAGTNAASAGGLTGSTPFAQQMQQNAGNIASQDQNQWLQNVLGVNNQYGAGQGSLMQGGQHAADIMSGLAQMMGNNMGAGAYGQRAGQNQDMNSIFSGILHMFGL